MPLSHALRCTRGQVGSHLLCRHRGGRQLCHLLPSAVDSALHNGKGSPGTPPGTRAGSLIPLGSGASVPTLSSDGSSGTIPELPFGSGILSRTDFKVDTGGEGQIAAIL